MYKDSNIMTDYIMSAEEVQTDVVGIADCNANDFRNLATCFPNKDPNDSFIRKQAVLDAQYPAYAAMRKDYGPYETITQGIERLRREGKLKAA
jgi:hypothetical protein